MAPLFGVPLFTAVRNSTAAVRSQFWSYLTGLTYVFSRIVLITSPRLLLLPGC